MSTALWWPGSRPQTRPQIPDLSESSLDLAADYPL